jgi:Holliday junction resolvasome RuvABC endonuclease subunit
MSCVVGIDASLTALGIARAIPGRPIDVRVVGSETAARIRARVGRYRSLITPLLRMIAECPEPPMVVIEGYAFNAGGSGAHSLIELGGVLRDRLDAMVEQWIEVPPTQLKQYVTGFGNADKHAMRAGVEKRWGRKFREHNEADAYALCALGLELSGFRAPGVQLDEQVARLVAESAPAKPPKPKTSKRQQRLGGVS